MKKLAEFSFAGIIIIQRYKEKILVELRGREKVRKGEEQSNKTNNTRIVLAEKNASEATKDQRITSKNARFLQNDLKDELGVVYGAGIAV